MGFTVVTASKRRPFLMLPGSHKAESWLSSVQVATGLLLLRLVLALSKLLLREFFELLDATYTKISTLSSSFFNERAGETIASPS